MEGYYYDVQFFSKNVYTVFYAPFCILHVAIHDTKNEDVLEHVVYFVIYIAPTN